jgi:fluoride ion exporter CrcB/FEX
MFQLIVNLLGTLTVGLCAVLLLRAYASVRKRLLFWSGMCFAGLTAANALLLADLWLVDASLYTWRLGTAAVAMLLLVYGLIFESDQP